MCRWGPEGQARAFAGFVAGQGGDGEAALGPSPHPDHGRVPAPGPGAAGGRRHREPGLVFEDDEGVERRRGASTCGHVSFIQPATLCSLRSRARFAGPWWLQPWRRSICVMVFWNRHPISTLIRSRGPRLVLPAVRNRPLGQLLLQDREQLLTQLGPGRRARGVQGGLTAELPGAAPALHRAHADPQSFSPPPRCRLPRRTCRPLAAGHPPERTAARPSDHHPADTSWFRRTATDTIRQPLRHHAHKLSNTNRKALAPHRNAPLTETGRLRLARWHGRGRLSPAPGRRTLPGLAHRRPAVGRPLPHAGRGRDE